MRERISVMAKYVEDHKFESVARRRVVISQIRWLPRVTRECWKLVATLELIFKQKLKSANVVLLVKLAFL